MSFKSLTKRISVDTAKRAHKCRYNKDHQIGAGEKRLKVIEGRSEQHYCLVCAKRFLGADIEKLNGILDGL